MDSNVFHIYKEDRCPQGQPEDCVPNFTWPPGLPDAFNYTLNGTWDVESEPMSPIIPIIVAVYSVVFVVGLVGNCLVMYVIIRWVGIFLKCGFKSLHERDVWNVYVYPCVYYTVNGVTRVLVYSNADVFITSGRSVLCQEFRAQSALC